MVNIRQPRKTSHTGATRRQFLRRGLALAGLSSVPVYAAELLKPVGRTFRAAIIGHTGHGNYGHEHDLIFSGRENITVAAVADPDAAGRAKAAARSHALRQYADYREMLEKEKPDLVCVAPRCTDEHHAMALAALRIGAHVYLEKPITQTLAEADELLALAERNSLKIVVAHQMRLAPNILALKKAIEEGSLGQLLEIRTHGKQDQRAGGEDLVVLGVHLFDLMRFFAGDPLWCTARVLQAGHEITASDAHPATEDIGPVAGDEIMAEFAFNQSMQATFVSRGKNREPAGPWGMELVGSQSSARILADIVPRTYLLKEGNWTTAGKTSEWRFWDQDPTSNSTGSGGGVARANKRVVDDWLAAIAQGREPVCGGYAAMKALEMAMAVFAAGLARGRVSFPLQNRQHPLVAGR